MSLGGNLRTMPVPDVLQWIAMGQKTGTLHLTRGSLEKRIVFKDGLIITSWSNDPRESLGQFLLRDRRLSEEELFMALLRQEEEGLLVGSIIVNDGTVDEAALRSTLQTKAEETIYELFLWPDGRFEFKEGELPRNLVFQVSLSVQAVVLEGIKRVDDWERIRKVFPSPDTTFTRAGPPEENEDPIEGELLKLVDAGKSLFEISLHLHRSEFETAALLYDLYARDRVAVDEVGEEEGTIDAVGAIRDLLGLAYRSLQERNYDGAQEAYKKVLDIDRLNQHAKKGLLELARRRQGERAAKLVPLDKVPVLVMEMAALTREHFDPQEGFILSRLNGQWDVRSILKLCPMPEQEALMIFARLLERHVIELR
jgi:hypothetical protein